MIIMKSVILFINTSVIKFIYNILPATQNVIIWLETNFFDENTY